MAAPAVSGFTLVRNAVLLDFPVVESIRSILPLCDEVVVNVGRSEDDTLELVRSIGDPRLRVLESVWDLSLGDRVLARETERAMRACRHPWGVYIQADEVLHEGGVPALRDALAEAAGDRRVEGLLVRYRHFFGDPGTEAVNRRWYRREIRAVRLDPAAQIHPFRDAQGFRVGPRHRRTRCRETAAEMFHYGWTRSAAALRARTVVNRRGNPGFSTWGGGAPLLRWFPGLRPFEGEHPMVARAWVERHRHDPERTIAPPEFAWGHWRLRASDRIERLTGRRVFEFRNYTML